MEGAAGAFFALHAKEAYGFQRKGMAQTEAKEGKRKGSVFLKQVNPSGTVISDTKIRPSEAAGRKKYEILSGDSLTAKSVAVSGILSEIIKEQVILFFNM